MLWPSRRERIARIADGWAARPEESLSATDLAERDAWRAADPAHEDAWQQAQLIMSATAGMRRPRNAAYTPPAGRLMRPSLALAGVAAVIIAAGGALVLERSHLVGTTAGSQIAEYSASGDVRHLRLADGTLVDLDVGAAMRADFSGPVRAITLERGAARFDVAHDADHPFVVAAADRTVTAIGTRFEVAIKPHGVVVSLFQGAVEVAGKSSAVTHKPVRMTRGQRLTVDDGRETMTAVSANDMSAAGPRDVPSTPATTIVDEANRTAAIPIRFADPALGQRPVQGRFDTRDTAALAAQLGAALDLVVSRNANGYLLSNP